MVSMIVFIPNKYSALRLCVEYPKLNALKVRDYYLILKMDWSIEYLENKRYYRL